MRENRTALLKESLARRILILDGAMGTMLQSFHLEEADFRKGHFESHSIPLKGDNDVLCLTRPDAVRSVHCQYLDAGADIIETNSFNANLVSQKEYGMTDQVYEMARAAAAIAAAAAAEYSTRTPEKPRFVAGSIGPTGSTLSMSPDVSDPAARDLTFDELVSAYTPGIEGLIDGGADILLIETVFDTLNAKAAAYAIGEVFARKNFRIPVMVSGTVSDASGRLLAGQSAEAFLISMLHTPELLSIGFNCALGPEEMRVHIEEIAAKAPVLISTHPNAGLPDELGHYAQTPERMAEVIRGFASDGLVNIVGGCCGTNPAHIRAIAQAVSGIAPRKVPAIRPKLRLAGLDPMVENENIPFMNVGERTNVAGSRKFLNLIKEENWTEALRIARSQVENGALIVDVNMDDALLDSKKCMETFLLNLAADPDIARVPVMIDSSNWQVILAGLKCIQGKCVVNSISLKEGEAPFLEKAREIRKFGAAVLAMAFDEQGQADTLDRRVSVCRRMYKLLTETVGFPPEDVIFDPNVFAVATGMPEHDNYAKDFIEAVRMIKQEMPLCHFSGGISNVSFSFRGNNLVRGALHSVFLYHAIHAGLNMGIVNPAQLEVYESIDPALRKAAEDVILNRAPDAAEKLLSIAADLASGPDAAASAGHGAGPGTQPEWRRESVERRLAHALIRGDDTYLAQDMEEALKSYERPVSIIEGPLMDAMREAGDLFAAGKMFLPQIVKTARTMKTAVGILTPALEHGQNAVCAGTVILATVKGDVHDIGKNIVSVILRCNNYRVIDLGVMTPAKTILDAAEKEHADVIALSGLITPSLAEMEIVASGMEKRGWKLPLFVGGATTSEAHTALHLQPKYSGVVVHTRDASRIVPVLNELMNPERRSAAEERIRAEHAAFIRQHEAHVAAQTKMTRTLTPAEAAALRVKIDFNAAPPVEPKFTGVARIQLPFTELAELIEWNTFLNSWKLSGCQACAAKERESLLADAKTLLKHWSDAGAAAPGVYGIFSAVPSDDANVVINGETQIHFQRRLTPLPDGTCPALSDFLSPSGDWMGMFAVTAGPAVQQGIADAEKTGDEYQSLLAKTLGNALAEAASEVLHRKVRTNFWGYAPQEDLAPADLLAGKYQGIRPAPGYPVCPDHELKRVIFRLLDAVSAIGVELTETAMMTPEQSTCGFYFAHPESRYFAI